jgi:NitT/TauT family transport system permease protein
MVFLSEDIKSGRMLARFRGAGATWSWADLAVFAMLAAGAILVFHGAEEIGGPLTQLQAEPVILDPSRLPGYALRSVLRMFAALAASLAFTFVVATLAAKSKKAELVIAPALDILQSVPVLGFLTFTVTFFLHLFPGQELGAECAAIFAIFTSQAWNMAFSFYQSLRTLPADLDEAARQFKLSPWRRFWRLEAPFATPALVWNAMMSMSGGWFFVVASEAITVGNTQVTLPGIGSYLALAIARQDNIAVAWAVAAMGAVIVAYDQLLFRPIIAWADKFRFEQTAGEAPTSWFYDLMQRTRLFRGVGKSASTMFKNMPRFAPPHLPRLGALDPRAALALDWGWVGLVIVVALWAAFSIAHYVLQHLTVADALNVFGLGLLTLLRVIILIALASLVWVPIGVWIGLRPKWAERVQPFAQFLAAFPANVLFPFAVMAIAAWRLNPDVWLSPLMILGTQWYILFNVIAGASVLPTELKEAASLYGLKGWQRWRDFILPGIFPFYVTGALTASGGSWNASIVAEVANWGSTRLQARGLGAYIAGATQAGDYPRVALGIAVMSIFVILLNRTLWRPLYAFAERRLRLA